MGALLSSLFALLWRSNRRHKVVIVGLDNAGKTTALFKLQLGAQRSNAVRRA
jgi:GTPase SAR1 family protein